MRLLILAITHVTPAIIMSGCIGGPIAQQIATSLISRGADKVINNSLEAQEREAKNHFVLKDTPPDPDFYTFVTSGFKTISPTVELLPASPGAVDGTALASAQTTRLVHVEIWNLIIGDEKEALLENAQAIGAELPPKSEWKNWRLASGALLDEKNKHVTFLIPPELGRIGSGDHAVVEIIQLDQLYVARYASN